MIHYTDQNGQKVTMSDEEVTAILTECGPPMSFQWYASTPSLPRRTQLMDALDLAKKRPGITPSYTSRRRTGLTWSKTELAMVKDTKIKSRVKSIAAYMERDEAEVMRLWEARNGAQKHRPWTEAEEKRMMDEWPDRGKREALIADLGRTFAACMDKYARMQGRR